MSTRVDQPCVPGSILQLTIAVLARYANGHAGLFGGQETKALANECLETLRPKLEAYYKERNKAGI